ncbi:hypothetical protein Ddc_13703 [Ditylenchus destructor]|nr:hypothetical protein Ddc_13703 [Ditylenchus destructor]
MERGEPIDQFSPISIILLYFDGAGWRICAEKWGSGSSEVGTLESKACKVSWELKLALGLKTQEFWLGDLGAWNPDLSAKEWPVGSQAWVP